MVDECFASLTTLSGSGGIACGLQGVKPLAQPVALSKQSVIGSSNARFGVGIVLLLPLVQTKQVRVGSLGFNRFRLPQLGQALRLVAIPNRRKARKNRDQSKRNRQLGQQALL